MRTLWLVPLFVVFLFSCKKEEPRITPVFEKAVLLVNEGNFNWGNASLSLFNLENNMLTKDVYKEVNGAALGDVAQSAIIKDSLVYIVVNNSAKIVALSAKTFKLKLVIPIAGSSPRYMLPINDSIAYVSDLYANKIWVVNYISGVVKSYISADGETNQMIKVNNTVFVSERSRFNGTPVAQVRVVNSTIHQTAKLIALPSQPNSICSDNSENIWVLTDTSATKHASLLSLDIASLTISKQLDFVSTESPKMLRFNKSNNSLCYIVRNQVFSYLPLSSSFPGSALFSVVASMLYAFDIDGKGQYYLADAIDYTQSSKCFIYDADGILQHTFTAGINTNQFVFLP